MRKYKIRLTVRHYIQVVYLVKFIIDEKRYKRKKYSTVYLLFEMWKKMQSRIAIEKMKHEGQNFLKFKSFSFSPHELDLLIEITDHIYFGEYETEILRDIREQKTKQEEIYLNLLNN